MASIFTTIPYPFDQREAQDLFMTVAKANNSAKAAMVLAQDAGLNTLPINDQQAAYYVWREVFTEAAAQGMLKPLISLIASRTNPNSTLFPYYTKILNETPVSVDAEPLNNDGSPKFITGNDDVTVNESLLYYDDLTLEVGRLPALLKVLEQMIQYTPSVCKLEVKIDMSFKFGTAFRIGDDMLLTNWHVVHREGDDKAATVVNATFGFEDDGQDGLLTGKPIKCDAASIVADKDDDWAIIRVKEPMDNAWPIIKLSEAVAPTESTSAYIIQHPMGERKRIGYVRNRVSNFNDRVVHYLTDTQDGSSGSPVFNSEGKLIALHHAGGRPQEIAGRPPMKKNEGIRISRITDALTQKQIAFL